MTVRNGYAEVNGTRLYYETGGTGEPLVLIHGHTLDTRTWDDQFEVFSNRYRVIRYDMRGFGRSALPGPVPYTPAEDLKALLDYLGAGRAHILGLSRGGAVALDYALMYPAATRSLVLADAGLWDFPWTHYADSVKTVREIAQKEGLAAARTAWLAQPLFAPALANPLAAGRLREMVQDYSGWHWRNEENLHLLDPPPIARLPELPVPALVVAGEHDLPDFLAIADLLARRIPSAEKVVLPEAGHLSAMEAPAAFNTTVLAFLARVSA